MKSIKLVLPILVGLLTLFPTLALGTLRVGDPAPDFSIPDTAWVNHRLSEQRGKVVMLLFWQEF